jgi:hypothetical protein
MRTLVLVFAVIGTALLNTACHGNVAPDSSPDAALGADGAACRSDNDCDVPSYFYCIGPYNYFAAPCGCSLDSVVCTEDSQCDAGTVCRSAVFVGNGGNCPGYETLVCQAPCTSDGDCAPTDSCTADGHCAHRTSAECPSYFSFSNGTCTDPSCSSDTDCPGGFCVNGGCAVSLGACTIPCGF